MNKEEFIASLLKNKGDIIGTLLLHNVPIDVFREWLSDKDFADEMGNLDEILRALVINGLAKKALNGDVKAAELYLKQTQKPKEEITQSNSLLVGILNTEFKPL